MLGAQKRPSDEVVDMSCIKVNVKWGKESFSDVEVDIQQAPAIFKAQLFALSGVPPDRQKVMIKGALLKDDDWGKAVPKEGATVMLMGSADAKPIEPPKNLPVFVEDLPESQQAHLETKQYGSGLQNLGNTCYMNSVVQCLYGVEPLRQALQTSAVVGTDPSSKLIGASKELMKDMETGGEPFSPYQFLMSMRQKFPQFAQTGEQGAPMQQDAEECWTNLLYCFREKVKAEDGQATVEKLFGINSRLKLKCEESGEEQEENSTSYMLKCNINNTINHLHDGILLGLKDDREKNSEALGKTVLFQGSSQLTKIPSYLTVQLVRFFYKIDTQQKAKVLRKVSFPLELDVYDYCSPELKAELDGPRAAYKEYQDRIIEEKKKAKNNKNAADSTPATTAAPADADTEMQDAAATSSSSSSNPHVGARTGKYQLIGCLTHKGRSADSGHYVAWVKQKDGKWVLFDDDDLSFKTDEDILNLCGGGDWHMAYLLQYKEVVVPK